MVRRRSQYEPGDLFCLPLSGGGHGVALVARRAASHRIGWATIFCYGFDRIFQEIPKLEDVRSLTICDAVCVEFCGDRSLADGRWTILGRLPGFRKEDWPVPPETYLLLRGESRPTEMSKQTIMVTEDVELRDVGVPNKNFIPAEHYQYLPVMTGLGDAIAFEYSLDRAIRQRDPRLYIKITPEVVQIWRDCLDRIRAAGLYPEPFDPNPPAAAEDDDSDEDDTPPPPGFWEIIDASRTAAGAGADAEAFLEAVTERVGKLRPGDLVQFQKDLHGWIGQANTWDLWAAAAAMNGGCSDDGFLSFRAWLVAQGKRIFQSAVVNPDSLAGARLRYGEPGAFELEELLYVAQEAAEAADADVDLPELPFPPRPPRGTPLREDVPEDLKQRVPRLWKKFQKGRSARG